MKNYKLPVTGIFICLLIAPLVAPVAFSLAKAEKPGPPVPPVSEAAAPRTISQLLEMIYEQIPGASQKPGEEPPYSEADYRVYLTAADKVVSLTPPEYLRGAVAAEMPLQYGDEALKAQIIAAHTYAVSYKIRERSNPTPRLRGADISDDPSIGQAYIDDARVRALYGDEAAGLMERLDRLIAEVGDIMMIYEGEPIVAAYHAISGGKTDSAQNIWGAYSPYLVAADSAADEESPDFLSKVMFSTSEVKEILTARGAVLGGDAKKWFDNLIVTPSGYITAGKFGGAEFTGAQLREAFGLRSANFTVSLKGDIFTFTVKGWGHGVGMSQYGAQALAQQGRTYTEILKKYYKGISFCEL